MDQWITSDSGLIKLRRESVDSWVLSAPRNESFAYILAYIGPENYEMFRYEGDGCMDRAKAKLAELTGGGQ